MRLPAVAIVLAFVSGIALRLSPATAGRAPGSHFLFASLCLAALLLAIGFVFLRRATLTAGALSLAAWLLLGFCGATLARQPKPTGYVLNLVDAGAIDLHTPLRWYGTLRDEPTQLPWGLALDIGLTSVDFQDRTVPLQGGLRVSYSPRLAHSAPSNPDSNDAQENLPAQPAIDALPEVHAGDEVTVIAQARLPQVFRDEGAFDRRAYLREQGVDLIATLRAPELLDRFAAAPPSAKGWLARARHRLREELSLLLPGAPEEAAVLRAMLLGDRSFLERSESANFQKTGVFHVLVVAGLHVGAFSAFLFWLARKFRLSRWWTSLAIVLSVMAYVAVVEQRPPVLRAALMTLIVVVSLLFFRRVELLNSVAVAALILLVASPSLLADSSFQLSFLAMFCIAGIAVPWLEKSLQPYARGLYGWRDVTRDVSHQPRVAQFRIDLRSVVSWVEYRLPPLFAPRATNFGARLLSLFFRIAEMLALTLVLQIGMLPFMARDFHRVTLSGPVANLLAVPLTAVLLPLGFLTLLAGLLFSRFATLLAVPLHWLTAALLHTVAWLAHFPRWSYRVPAPPFWLALLFFGAAVLLAVALRGSASLGPWWKRAGLALAAVAALLIATHPFAPAHRRGWLELNVLDVGQGDSLLLVSPLGHTILVDAGGAFSDPSHTGGGASGPDPGPDPGEDAVSAYLWSRGFQELDVVALTHAHQDHLGGLFAIFDNFRVKNLWIGREVALSQQRQLEALAASKGAQITHELRGEHLLWDGASLDFLWPQIVPAEVAPSAKNEDSLVFHVAFGQRSFLLPGDAEKLAERAMLSESAAQTLQADILKVGHHGSKNSSTPEFLYAIQPKLAVISAGEENPYGHPSPVLLARLQRAGVAVLRTDQEGAIHIATDGTRFEVSCFVACSQVTAMLNSAQPSTPDQQQDAKQE